MKNEFELKFVDYEANEADEGKVVDGNNDDGVTSVNDAGVTSVNDAERIPKDKVMNSGTNSGANSMDADQVKVDSDVNYQSTSN